MKKKYQIQCGLTDYECLKVDVICTEENLSIVANAIILAEREKYGRPIACVAKEGGNASFGWGGSDIVFCDCM